MRFAIVLGTRPEIIKMSPVVRACEAAGVDFFILHTGQHYSREMDAVFFEDLGLPPPLVNLEVGSGSHGAQTARMLAGIERVLVQEQASHVLVQGDTNTVVAAAMAASKLQLPIGHVEAGLRSHDRAMPEEINRIIADHVSTHLFAPTTESARLLRAEGLPKERIHVTGNTIVDAVERNVALARARGRAAWDGQEARDYVLLTAHRQENVDDAYRFQGILSGARQVGAELGVEVVYPVHPRSRARIREWGLDTTGIRLIEPLDFFAFLLAESRARIILTDSGGVQEESCILGTPCVTVRDSTERPETVMAGANILAGVQPERIRAAAKTMLARPRASWKNPFGDGRAAQRIVRIMRAGGVPALPPAAVATG